MLEEFLLEAEDGNLGMVPLHHHQSSRSRPSTQTAKHHFLFHEGSECQCLGGETEALNTVVTVSCGSAILLEEWDQPRSPASRLRVLSV